MKYYKVNKGNSWRILTGDEKYTYKILDSSISWSRKIQHTYTLKSWYDDGWIIEEIPEEEIFLEMI